MRVRVLALVIAAVIGVVLWWKFSLSRHSSSDDRPTRAREDSSSAEKLRCYRVTFEPDTFARAVPMRSGQRLPGVIALSQTMLSAPWRRASVRIGTERSGVWSSAKWSSTSGDSSEILIPTINWAVGILVHLPMGGDTIRGTASVYVDTPSGRSDKALVEAIVVSCPDSVPLRFPDEADDASSSHM